MIEGEENVKVDGGALRARGLIAWDDMSENIAGKGRNAQGKPDRKTHMKQGWEDSGGQLRACTKYFPTLSSLLPAINIH